jgi:hypothetical protein
MFPMRSSVNMSYKRVRTLGDVQRFGLLLLVICAGCGRQRLIAPGLLMQRFRASETFDVIAARMRCRGADIEGGGCGHRGAIVRLYDPPTPPPPETDPDRPGGNVLPLPQPKRLGLYGEVPQRGRRRARR